MFMMVQTFRFISVSPRPAFREPCEVRWRAPAAPRCASSVPPRSTLRMAMMRVLLGIFYEAVDFPCPSTCALLHKVKGPTHQPGIIRLSGFI